MYTHLEQRGRPEPPIHVGTLKKMKAEGEAICQATDIPVIGIGAGPHVDGQIFVLYDMLDITPGRKPKFVRNFMAGTDSPLEALRGYVKFVKDRSYPAPGNCFS